jgi:diguanylate cyclase (GGDEF)-like protein/PAS domain S-box-containing protein
VKQALRQLQQQFFFSVFTSFALTPIIGYWVALFLGLASRDVLFQQPAISILVLCYLLLTGWAGVYFYRYLKPLHKWLLNNPGSNFIPEKYDQHLRGFTDSYWSFFLIYTLVIPSIQHWFGAFPQDAAGYSSLLQFILLQLVISLMVGMPGYLYALSLLGRMAEYTGLRSVQIGMKTKMLLIGAYIPLLMTTIMLKYYWWRTEYLSSEILLGWLSLGLMAFVLAFIAIRGLNQALQPVYNFINSSGASHYPSLIKRLRPHSTDEVGYLVQTLGNVFKRLQEQETHTEAIIATAAEGIIVVDSEYLVKNFNPAAERLFGYSGLEIHDKPIDWIIPNFPKHDVAENMLVEMESSGLNKNNSEFPISMRISEMRLDSQIYYTCMVADISARKASEKLLMDAEARYRNLVVTAHDLVWSMDTEGNWTYLNDATRRIYGYRAEEMLQHHYSEFQDPQSVERDQEAFEKLLNGKELVNYETIHLDKNNQLRHISFNARPNLDEQGNVTSITGTARDITEQKAFEHELTYQAQHDSLTGLYNRNYFQQELERVVSRVARNASSCALLYLDVDQFKYINDTLGHVAGDKLLQEVTHLLQRNLREGDLLARFGGDEFTILLYNIEQHHAEKTAENIRALLEAYRFIEEGKSYNVTCSIGVAIIDNHCSSASEALSRADLACNIAKAQGRNRVHVHNQQDKQIDGMAEDMGWAARVRDAYENNHFNLVYQPIVSISNGDVHTYEVLLRMTMEDGNDMLPGGFMPAAERFGLIKNVDRWTVSHAMHYLVELHKSDPRIRFAINLSGYAFEDSKLLPMIHDILKQTGLEPSALTFEITETAAIANLAAATQFIHKLKELGCQFALDDFGSGFCSFTYLKHLPVDKLKIDGSFVQGMADTPIDQAMVQSMNQIAHALGKKTIAEFVENETTLDLLREYGVDYAQGYHCGKPLQSIDLKSKSVH